MPLISPHEEILPHPHHPSSSVNISSSSSSSLPSLFQTILPRFIVLVPVTMAVTTKATIASFGGKLLKLSHAATSTKCEMSFNLYLPPQAVSGQKVPVLIYLSGLTCTADNCSEKGFFQHGASKKGIAVLYPDTSPRAYSPITPTINLPTDPTNLANRRSEHSG